jgi:hypothetical protein
MEDRTKMVNAISGNVTADAVVASSSPQAQKQDPAVQDRTTAKDTVSISAQGQKLSQSSGKDGDNDAS